MTYRPLLVLSAIISLSLPAQARTWVVNGSTPAATDGGAGTASQPLKTINAAAQKAEPGDTVSIRAGIYRETVVPSRGGEENKPITYEAAPGEKVIIRGSELWQPQWTAVPGAKDTYRASLPALKDYNPFALPAQGAREKKTLGQVFSAGTLLTEAGATENLSNNPLTWRSVDNGTAIEIYAPQKPPSELEISVRRSLFRPEKRGLGYITLRNLTFEHCANPTSHLFWKEESQPQVGAVSTRSGNHWVIEGNTIRFAKGIGLECGSEALRRKLDDQPAPPNAGHHVIVKNTISDNGQIGLAGSGQIGTRIANNIIERNNYLGMDSEEEAGIKCHYFFDGLIENNLVRDNDSFGIWLDNVWQGSVIRRNICLNNRTAGIFMEMGTGPCTIEDNVLAGTRPNVKSPDKKGDGLYSHDASGLTVRNNLIFDNAGYGITMKLISLRPFEVYAPGQTALWGPRLRHEVVGVSNETIRENLLLNNARGAVNLRLADDAHNNLCDYNLLSPNATGALRFASTDGVWMAEPVKQALISRNFQDVADKTYPKPSSKSYSLAQWRETTNFDLHSAVVKAEAKLTGSDQIQLSINLDGPITTGPSGIWKLQSGQNQWKLWPPDGR